MNSWRRSLPQNINCKQIFTAAKKKKKRSGRNIFFSLQQELILALAEDPNWSRNIWTLQRTFSFGRNVICVDPPPRSKIPTVLLVSCLRWPKKIFYFNPAATTKRHPHFRTKILFMHRSYIKPESNPKWMLAKPRKYRILSACSAHLSESSWLSRPGCLHLED